MILFLFICVVFVVGFLAGIICAVVVEAKEQGTFDPDWSEFLTERFKNAIRNSKK